MTYIRSLLSNLKFKKQEVILLVFVLAISFFLWSYIVDTQFQGEGFYYFTEAVSAFPSGHNLSPDLFARAIFHILPNLFGGQVSSYMWFQLVWMILTDVVFYLMVRTVTKNRFITNRNDLLKPSAIAILATYFFSLSYVGKYDMFSIGGYQYFVQRGAILLPQLLSFLFLSIYLRRINSIWPFIFSLLLYILSIVMGFFGTWFLPPFLFYPLFYLLFNWQDTKKYVWRIIWTPFPFLLGNLLIIGQSGFIPGESIQSFVFNNLLHVVEGISQQIAAVTPGLGEILKLYHKGSLQFEEIIILTIVLYCVAFMVVYKTNKSLRALAATTLVSLGTILLLNMYLNEANVLRTFGSSRYFYYPFTMVAIFWSLFFYSVASKGKLCSKFLLLFCLVWLSYNVYRIKENQKADAWIQQANRETIDYLRKISVKLGNGSIVHLPASLGGWGHEFVLRFYGKPGIKFTMEISEPLDLEMLVEQNVDAQKVYVLHFDPKTQKVVDLSESVRKQILELQMKKKG